MRTSMICVVILSVVSFIAAGAWWYVFLNDNFLFSEEQLDFGLGWGIISNIILGMVALFWFGFCLVKLVEYFAKKSDG